MKARRVEASCQRYDRNPLQKAPRRTSRKFPLPLSLPWTGSSAFQTDRNELAYVNFRLSIADLRLEEMKSAKLRNASDPIENRKS